MAYFNEILDHYDFAFTDGCKWENSTILVVRDLERIGSNIFRGIAQSPEGISSACTKADVLRYQVDRDVKPITIRWSHTCLPPGSAGVTILYKVIALVDAEHDFHVDSGCVPIFLSEPSTLHTNTVELCAGGYGGWKKACVFLERHSSLSFRTLGIESSLEAAWTYAVANAVPLANGLRLFPVGFLRSCQNLVLHSSLQDAKWLTTAGFWGIDIMTLSAPCQPWSLAGLSEGLDSPHGQALADGIAAAKLLRPRILLLEQVPGFQSHDHKKLILRLLRWAGFSLKFQSVIDSGDVTAATRARWLGLAVRASDNQLTDKDFQIWCKIAGITPNSFGVMLDGDWIKDERLKPSREVIEISSNPAYLPPLKRKHVPDHAVFSSRCLSADSKAPTIVASYGSQHCFAPSSLETRGLLSHFVIGKDGARFWHPIELLLMHGFCGQQ